MSTEEKIEVLQMLRNSTQVSDLRGTLWGLCGEIEMLLLKGYVDKDQRDFLKNLLHESTGADSWGYVWPARKLLPRIKWIDRQIKLLQNDSKL